MAPSRSRRRRAAQGADPERLDRELQDLVAEIGAYSIDISSGARTMLEQFARELLSWNRRHNLLSRADENNLVRKHVAASLGVFLISPYVEGQRWVDVGTGAGFPGLVLRLADPRVDMTLVDSSRKRCDFLESVTMRLSPSTMVINQRAEDLVAHDAEGFDVLTSKAVAPLGDCVEYFGALVRPGGRLITFKGPHWPEEVEQAQQRKKLEKYHFAPECAIRVPWVEAHLVSLFRDLRA